MSNPKLVIQAWAQCGLPGAVAEYHFHADRKWRFDYAFVEQRVALEVQGGIFTRGRHTRGAALKKEWEKLNHAAAAGWLILYCAPGEECRRPLIDLLKAAVG